MSGMAVSVLVVPLIAATPTTRNTTDKAARSAMTINSGTNERVASHTRRRPIPAGRPVERSHERTSSGRAPQESGPKGGGGEPHPAAPDPRGPTSGEEPRAYQLWSRARRANTPRQESSEARAAKERFRPTEPEHDQEAEYHRPKEHQRLGHGKKIPCRGPTAGPPDDPHRKHRHGRYESCAADGDPRTSQAHQPVARLQFEQGEAPGSGEQRPRAVAP